MLRETRATKYVHDAANAEIEITVDAGGDSATGKTFKANANLLLDAKKSLVGVDLRETEADVVLMLGAHEDVVDQVEGSVKIVLTKGGELANVTLGKSAASSITNPGKNPYIS